MPYKIENRGGKKPWKIVDVKSGKVVGSAKSEAAAKKSARARLAGEHGWRPQKKQ